MSLIRSRLDISITLSTKRKPVFSRLFYFLTMGPVVYILYSNSLEKFYIGETENLDKRLTWHNDPNLNTNFSRKGIPWSLFFSIPCHSRIQARKIEKHIKNMKSKKYLINLKKYPEISAKLLEKYQ